MLLRFQKVETPAETAGFVGLDSYQATRRVRLACGHEQEVRLALSAEALVKIGCAFLAGQLDSAERMNDRILAGAVEAAEHVRCPECEACIRH